ncbi:hypothetical protein [Thiolapillus sp.]|uniref:hypothetical protein n=1 Tax=Thiolapillus sp. TaxID=2017437 RepID=UPI003AF57A4C
MFSLWRKARRENSAASRLLGTTSLRFALHGWQRMTNVLVNPVIPESDQELVSNIFGGVEELLGFVPAGLRLYGISPPLLQSFVGSVGYFTSVSSTS